MAGFVALCNGCDSFLGSYKSTEVNGVENGQFVVLDHVAKTGSLASVATGDGEVYFVHNEIDTVDEFRINDIDFKVAKDKYLRVHRPQKGEILVTTKFNGTLNEGDVVAVGVGGNVEAVGTRTPAVKFVVKEKSFEYGVDAVRLLAI